MAGPVFWIDNGVDKYLVCTIYFEQTHLAACYLVVLFSLASNSRKTSI